MPETSETTIIDERLFIMATRDTGYRSTAAAIAELVDNSIQAGASIIRIFTQQDGVGSERQVSIGVLDNGCGMDSTTLRRALQFAGSSRFNNRKGLGRFGMGLPNSSVSQARRVDVYAWTDGGRVRRSYLDVDEIAEGRMAAIPRPKLAELPPWCQKHVRKRSGTFVLWTRCDRLDARKAQTIAERLHRPLGQRFRYFIWSGNKIYINDDLVSAVDPLCLTMGEGGAAAVPFGDDLTFEFRIPADPSRTSTVRVKFSELPVAEWHSLPAETKRQAGIVKGAGVSVVRSGREVDFGWYFMGGKRKENYDDWWRCEVSFEPELDELFGVTHSKQEINPSELLRAELSQHLEAIAQTLNSRARAAFSLGRKQEQVHQTPSEIRASEREPFLPPPVAHSASLRSTGNSNGRPDTGTTKKRKLEFQIKSEPLDLPDMYVWSMTGEGVAVVTVNENHAFFDHVFSRLSNTCPHITNGIESLLLALARAEMALHEEESRCVVKQHRMAFSNILAAYLGD